MLYSYWFFVGTWPLLQVFINAFLWRQANDIRMLAIYNLGQFIGLSLGFFLNGLMLRRIKTANMYLVGAVGQGVATFMAIAFPSVNLLHVGFYGLWFGITGGIYWGNKMYITLKITKGTNRVYFAGLESGGDLLLNIVTPFLIGWIIVLGEKYGLYAVDTAYKILAAIAILSLSVSGLILKSADLPEEKVKEVVVKNPTKNWNVLRLMEAIYWTMGGLNFFLPSALVLLFIGNEGILGTLQSIMSIMGALALYAIGRKVQVQGLLKVMVGGIGVLVIAAAFMSTLFNFIGALIYVTVIPAVAIIMWNMRNIVDYEVMDAEKDRGYAQEQYPFVFDSELFFNIGRVFAVGVFLWVVSAYSQEAALRWVPLGFALIQFTLLFPMRYLLSYVRRKEA